MLRFSKGVAEEEGEEITSDTHGLTSYHVLRGIRDRVHDHYRQRNYELVMKEAEPLLEGVREVEESKHSTFRHIMRRAMDVWMFKN